jgi:chemotaxis protein MotB
MARGRKKKPEGRQKDPSLVMFLALNMILLAFFILLVAMSQPNVSKANKLAIELRRAFQSFGGSFLGAGTFVDQSGVSRDQNLEESNERVESFLGELTQFMEANEESKALSFDITAEGLIINVSEAFLFREGSAEMLEQGLPVFDSIYSLILRTNNEIRIEGHTDNTTIRTREVRDTWDLSAQRALAVFRLFTASRELPPERFSAVGYGPHRPMASNLSAEGRASNRRVTIVFVGQLTRLDAAESGQ